MLIFFFFILRLMHFLPFYSISEKKHLNVIAKIKFIVAQEIMHKKDESDAFNVSIYIN